LSQPSPPTVEELLGISYGPPPQSFWKAYGRHILLFALTAASIFAAGGLKEVLLPAGTGTALRIDWSEGLRLVVGLMSILFAHEMGHYLACRYYGVDATLPFFIPAPFLTLVGTLGAFIRIRGPIPHRRALFDIGIAGPIAGFVVSLPVLLLGIAEADIAPTPPPSPGLLSMGEPLLFQWAVHLVQGPIADGYTLMLGPLGLAAWFGLFVTALNMMPVGQLDGGHVMYAMIRRRATVVSRLGILACLGLLYLRPMWLLWSVLLLLLARRPHPPTLYDEAPLGRGRIVVGILGFVMFAVCFTPSPILVSWPDFLDNLSELSSALTSR
jgi:membrane-associated protease RseP (regulator of RpoE activity)